MLIARRKFVKAGLLFGASAALIWGNGPSVFAGTLTDDSQLSHKVLRDPVYRFTRETFEPYVGGYFEANDGRGEMIPLKLVKVDAYTPKTDTKLSIRPAVDTESFSLTFNADTALPRSKSIHQIKHGALGEFNLFLTRRDGPNQICYDAVFNHIR